MKMFKSNSKGFTLIELLVVIAIIGILSSVVLASLNSAKKKSRDARRVADIGQIKLALSCILTLILQLVILGLCQLLRQHIYQLYR